MHVCKCFLLPCFGGVAVHQRKQRARAAAAFAENQRERCAETNGKEWSVFDEKSMVVIVGKWRLF